LIIEHLFLVVVGWDWDDAIRKMQVKITKEVLQYLDSLAYFVSMPTEKIHTTKCIRSTWALLRDPDLSNTYRKRAMLFPFHG